jgi:RsiW-degrading membrane proteinase PrsW (M82 family)
MPTWDALLVVPILAFAPGIFWLWYFYKKDKAEPEPLAEIRRCFFLGMVVALPASIINDLAHVVSTGLFLFVSAPIVEESFKFLVVRKTIYEKREFDQPMDGVVYGVAVALGFASVENLYYLGKTYSEGYELFATVVVLRAFLSVPAHALWACIWGFALGLAKFSEPSKRRGIIAKGLVLAMVLHSTFNVIAMTGPLFALGMLILTPVLWKIANKRIRDALSLSEHLPPAPETSSAESSSPE